MSVGRQLRSVIALPFNAIVTVPAILLWLIPRRPGFERGGLVVAIMGAALGLCSALLGLTLMVKTIRLFGRLGRGTLAPWDPTVHLVIEGPYRYVRNPMISGVALVLLGEALATGSLALLAWFALFVLVNAIYMPVFEEPGLVKRFGREYRDYAEHVPRWIPRRTPWSPRSTP